MDINKKNYQPQSEEEKGSVNPLSKGEKDGQVRVNLTDFFDAVLGARETEVKIDVKPSRLEKLRKIGVKGSGTELSQVIEKWRDDDLTLRLLGGYLVHCQKLGIEQPYPEPSCPLPPDDPLVGIEEILGFFDRNLIVTDKLKSLLKTATTFCEDIPNSLVEEAPEFVDWGFFQYSTGLKAYSMPKPIRTYYIRKRNQAAIKILNSWFENKK
ncbi:MAG: hypothetical protein GPJ22_01220 [Microcystis aeruginosa LL13-03]|jgi:hypothetical protein|nr:hypothetical protein [Microcystis aeruginosa LL13-03]NCR65591.1 hypothetical protein [Microcystis aeruginosa LL11-07]NCS03660.1 hypothetical protein [Microcystis aeruginosa G13-11]NCS05639.1 hypothetical protein [Microcystis aeruginosa G13-07]NCS21758.1 hypothetical protein [Microcystis aeruginosa G11-06]